MFKVVVIAVLLIAASLTNAVLVQRALAQPAVDWPMFRFNTEHTGATPESVTPPLQLKWSVGGLHTSSAVSDGVVYVVGGGILHALDADNGDLKWEYNTDTGPWLLGSPAVADGRVYVGSEDYKVYCLNATTGDFVWSYKAGDWTDWSSPAVSGGVVYVGSDDYNVYALDADNGDLKWNYATGYFVRSSPAVSGGVVYVGSDDGNVYALEANTGAQKWNYTTGGFVRSSPAVSGGVVYIGSYDGNVYALDAVTGAQKWNYTTGDYVRSSPAVSGGVVYVGSDDYNAYALDADNGAQKWNYTTGNWVESSPAVSGGVVYIGSDDGNVYALEANTGAQKWNYTIGGYVMASPAVSGGVVYVGSNAFSRAPNHDVGVDGVTVAKTVVGGYSTVLGQGLGLNVSVTVTNYGTFTETFNVTMYANTTQEASENITLASGQSTTINISWRTSPPTLAYGNYTVSASADPVQGETNIENNNNSAVGLLMVAGAGDLTGGTANALDFVPDGKVNIIDIAVVSKFTMQKSPPAPANCDVSGPTVGMPDGKIDISDIALVAKHFGKRYTYP